MGLSLNLQSVYQVLLKFNKMNFSWIFIQIILFSCSLAYSDGEVQVPRVLDVAPVILPADISDGIQWSDDVKDQPDDAVVLPAEIVGGIPWSDEDYQQPRAPVNPFDKYSDLPKLADYDYGPLSVRSDEYYEELAQFMRQLDYYEDLDYSSDYTRELYKDDELKDAIERIINENEDEADYEIPVEKQEDDISPNLNNGEIPVADLADFYQTFEANKMYDNDEYRYDEIVGDGDYIVYEDITDLLKSDNLKDENLPAKSDDDSSEESSLESEEDSDERKEMANAVESLYEDIFGTKEKSVRYQNIGYDLSLMEFAAYIGMFLGFILITFGVFVLIIRLLRFQCFTSPDVIEAKPEQVKNVKLSGIIKSYARLPVEIRNMEPSNVAYKELYEV